MVHLDGSLWMKMDVLPPEVLRTSSLCPVHSDVTICGIVCVSPNWSERYSCGEDRLDSPFKEGGIGLLGQRRERNLGLCEIPSRELDRCTLLCLAGPFRLKVEEERVIYK